MLTSEYNWGQYFCTPTVLIIGKGRPRALAWQQTTLYIIHCMAQTKCRWPAGEYLATGNI